MQVSSAAPGQVREREPLSGLELDAWRGFLATHARLVRALDDEMVEREGLTVAEYEVLLLIALERGGAARMSLIADQSLLSLSGTSRLVDRLERAGLVERRRDPDDRRAVIAALTPSGREKWRSARRVHQEGVRRLFLARLAPADLASLATIWHQLDTEGARRKC